MRTLWTVRRSTEKRPRRARVMGMQRLPKAAWHGWIALLLCQKPDPDNAIVMMECAQKRGAFSLTGLDLLQDERWLDTEGVVCLSSCMSVIMDKVHFFS